MIAATWYAGRRAWVGPKEDGMDWRVTIASISLALAVGTTGARATGGANPVVLISTSRGDVKVELYRDKAPKTVGNFLTYVDEKFYDGTIFHRVVANFVIQGGGFDVNMKRRVTKDPIKNEADNGLKNETGTLAMARTGNPHSATSQFFINLRDNTFLNYRNKTPRGWGYAVFGRVIEGMDVVTAIGKVRTTVRNGMRDVPEEPVVIRKVRRVK